MSIEMIEVERYDTGTAMQVGGSNITCYEVKVTTVESTSLKEEHPCGGTFYNFLIMQLERAPAANVVGDSKPFSLLAKDSNFIHTILLTCFAFTKINK